LNMVKLKFICLALLAPVLSSPAFAGGWGLDSKIAEIRVAVSGDLIVKTAVSHGDPDACGRNREILILKNNPGFEVQASLLVTAMHAQTDVRFYLNGCAWGTPPDAFAASGNDFIFLK
jgi:hypothetical protein